MLRRRPQISGPRTDSDNALAPLTRVGQDPGSDRLPKVNPLPNDASSPVAVDLTRPDRPDPFLGDHELRAAYRAITAGEWSTLENFLGQPRLAWMLRGILAGEVVDLETVFIDRWVEHASSPLALSYRATFSVRDALKDWFALPIIQKSGVQVATPPSARQVEAAERRFLRQIHEAEQSLYQVAQLRPDLPDPWIGLLITGRCQGAPLETIRNRFDNAHSRSVFHPDACREYLQSLSKKWGGSNTAVMDLARWIEAESPEGSPARESLPMAHIERALFEVGLDDLATYMAQDDVAYELTEGAARLLRHTPDPAPTELLPALNAYVLALTIDGPITARLIAQLLSRIGGRFTEWPWSLYSDDTALAFHQVQAEQLRLSRRY